MPSELEKKLHAIDAILDSLDKMVEEGKLNPAEVALFGVVAGLTELVAILAEPRIIHA